METAENQSKSTSPPKPSQLPRPVGMGLTRGLSKESLVSVASQVVDDWIVGDRCYVSGVRPGKVAFVGETHFGPGDWAGVVLDEPTGKNDGSVMGLRYFQCSPYHGLFCRLTKLSRHSLTRFKSVTSSIQDDSGLDGPSEAAPSSWSVGSPPPVPSSPLTSSANSSLRLGDRVAVGGHRQGTLRYLGPTDFAAGVWAGIELDLPYGKNDGSVQGKRYFACKPSYGLFAPVEKVEVPQDSKSWNSAVKQKTPIVHHNIASLMRTRRHQSLRGSQESLTSLSSVHSSASRRIRLGVSALSTCTPSGKHFNAKEQILDSSPAAVAMKNALKEKEQHIDQLLKERDIERCEMAHLTQLMEQRERELKDAREDGTATANHLQAKVDLLQSTIDNMEKENKRILEALEVEKQKNDDLSFRLDEEMCLRKELKAKLSEQEEHIGRLTAEIEHQGTRCIALQNQVASLEETLRAANQKPQVADVGQQCNQMPTAEVQTVVTLDRLEVENANLDELLIAQLNLLASCQEKMDLQSSTIQKLTAEVDRMKIQTAESSSTADMALESTSKTSDAVSEVTNDERTTESRAAPSTAGAEALDSAPSVAGNGDSCLDSGEISEKRNIASPLGKRTSPNAKGVEVFDDPERIKQVCLLEDEIKRVTLLLQMRESETEGLRTSLQERAMECKRLEDEFASFRSEMNHLREERFRSPIESCSKGSSESQSVPTDDLPMPSGRSDSNGSADTDEAAKSFRWHLRIRSNVCHFRQRQHISFLESIIADQQVKIDQLKQLVEDNLSVGKKKCNGFDEELKIVFPRKYCDFCEIFDSHELEECDKYNQKINESANHTSYGFPRGHERSYCSACEMFGHTKEECPSAMQAIL